MVHSDPLYKDWLNLNLHLLWCYDRAIGQSGNRENDAVRPFYRNSGAWLVRRGWARVEHDGRVFEAGPGEWLIVKPCKRIQRFDPSTEILSVSFDARWPDGSNLYDSGLSLVFDASEFPLLEKRAFPMVRLLRRLSPETWDARQSHVGFASFLALERHLCSWLAALAQVLGAHGIEPAARLRLDDRVMEAVRILNSLDPGLSLSLKELAGRIAVSPAHLSRLFQRDLETTPARYFERLRIERACSLLRQPDTRISEVAHRLGFTYLSHFSRWFKNHTGYSPRVYREEGDTPPQNRCAPPW